MSEFEKENISAVSTASEGSKEESPMVNFGTSNPLDVDTSGVWKITSDNIMKMVIGSPINSPDSTFQTSPIFDIPQLDKKNKLDINVSTAKAKSSMGLFSNKNASTDSVMFGLDIGISAKSSFGVGPEASLGFSLKNARQNSVSSGETSLSMIYEIYDSYVDVLVTHFKERENFSTFLIGEALDDAALDKSVYYNSEKNELTITEKYLDDQGNVYGNVQLLGRMEDIFGRMKKEYEDEKTTPESRVALVNNMRKLKNAIGEAIQKFYSRYGDMFASRLWLAAYAVGGGKLNYDNTSGNSQNQYSAKVSCGFSALGVSGSLSSAVSYAKQHGYSTAMKSINVEAIAVPASTVDTNAWVSAITKTLQEEGGALSVPSAGNFAAPVINIPDAPEPKKKPPLEPPSSCFKSYDDWKQYLADKKADEAMKKTKDNVEKAQNDYDELGLVELFNLEDANAQEHADKYKIFIRELYRGKSTENGKVFKSPIQDLRVKNRIVVGFDTTLYNEVLPQLRPDLSIPDQAIHFPSFPNLSKLLVTNTNLSKLGCYIDFMNNFCVSGLRGTDLASKFDSFLNEFLEKSNILIANSLQKGADIEENLIKGMLFNCFGNPNRPDDYKDCELSKTMVNEQKYRYIIYLLSPNVQKIWAEAPGGYVNIICNKKDAEYDYAIPKYVGSTGVVELKRDTCVCEPLDWDNPGVNPLSLFPHTVQTPLYPIFVYTATGNPKLYFLQMIRNMQLVLTAQDAQFSGPADYKSVAFLRDQQIEPKQIVDQNFNIKDDNKYFKFDNSKEGFSLSEKDHTWDYGLNFSFIYQDQETQQNKANSNQVLILTGFSKATFENGYSCGSNYHDPHNFLDKHSNSNKAKIKNEEFIFSDEPCLMLLPIKSGEYDTVGFNSQAFSMYSNYGPKQIVECSSLNNAIDLSVIK